MKTTTIIDKRELYYTLSKLISNSPFEQVEWVKAILNNPFSKQFNYVIDGLSYMNDFETHLNKAGLFMLVQVFESEETKKKEIVKVQFFEDVNDIENSLMDIYDIRNFLYNQYRLFYYNKEAGYVEILYYIGEYRVFKGSRYHDLERDGLTPKPEVTYYEGNADDYCKVNQNNKSFFLEIPNLYEIELGYIEDDEQGVASGVDTKQYYFFKSFDKALDYASKEILNYSTDYDRVIISNRWYSYYLYLDTEDKEEPEENYDKFSCYNSFGQRLTKEVTLKFGE